MPRSNSSVGSQGDCSWVTRRSHQIFSTASFSWSWYVNKHIICVIDTRSFGLARQWKPRQLFRVKGKEGHRRRINYQINVRKNLIRLLRNVARPRAHFEEYSKQPVGWIWSVSRDTWDKSISVLQLVLLLLFLGHPLCWKMFPHFQFSAPLLFPPHFSSILHIGKHLMQDLHHANLCRNEIKVIKHNNCFF